MLFRSARLFPGRLNGSIKIEFLLWRIHPRGKLPQAAQRSLELAHPDHGIPPEVLKLPFACYLECPAVPGLPADPDAGGAVSRIPKRGHSARPDPMAAAVMLLMLLLKPLEEHPLDLPQVFAQELPGGIRVIVVLLLSRIVQPVQKLLGNLSARFLYLLKVFEIGRASCRERV